MKGPFFIDLLIVYQLFFPSFNNMLCRIFLPVAGFETFCRNASARSRMTSRSPSFTTAHGVIDRVHGNAAYVRAASQPAAAAGLAQGLVFMIDVADLANGCLAADGNHAHLAGRQAQNGVLPFLGDELGAAAGRTGQLSPFTRFQFNVVNHRSQWNVGQPEAVAGLDIRIAAGHDHVSNSQADWGEDVTFFTVLVMEQRNVSGAVGVVLNGGNLGWNILFITFEINDAKAAFVSASAMPGGYTPSVVAASGPLKRFNETLAGLIPSDLGERTIGLESPSRRCWIYFSDAH